MTEPVFPEFNTDGYDDDELLHFQQIINDLGDIRMKAIKTAIKDKYTQYYKKLIDEEQYEHFPGCCRYELQKVHKLKKKADTITDMKQGNNSHCFYTINFKPDSQNIEEIQKVMTDFTEKCKFVKDDYIYSIEQRSEDMATAGQGAHVHILFKKGDNAPSKIERAFKGKFFDKYVANCAALDYRYITEDKVTDKLEYIMGIKKKDKMPKVLIDRKWRKEHIGNDLWTSKNRPYQEKFEFAQEHDPILSKNGLNCVSYR